MNDELKTRLMTEFGLTEEQVGKLAEEGVESEADLALLDANEINRLTGCGLVRAKKVYAAFVPTTSAGATPPPNMMASAGGSTMQALSILPALPDETSFLEMLKTGGILKVETTEVISAVKAAFAKRAKLYDLPGIILERMEDFAEKQEEPCGEQYFATQKLLTERRYGEVLSAIGVPGSYVSDRRKNDFFSRLELRLWPALTGFQKQVTEWQQGWMQGVANPGMFMLAFAAKEAGSPLPPGMMQSPDTSSLHAAAEEVVNEINRIFAGPGIPVARALAWDASRIMSILNEPTLPAQIGAGTREQMLKDLGVTVGSDLVRTEQNITRYTLAVMSLPKVPADSEYAYLGALIQLGSSIAWDKLASGGTEVEMPRRRSGTPRTNTGLGRGEEADSDRDDRFRS